MNLQTLQAALRFVRPAAADGDIRGYLNGVYAEPYGTGVRFTATDGHRLHRIEVCNCEIAACAILPAQFVDAILKLKCPKRTVVAVTLAITPELATLTHPDGVISGKPLEGTYPDIDRVIPSGDLQGEAVGINGHYLADAASAFARLTTGGGMAMRLRGAQKCTEYGLPNDLAPGDLDLAFPLAIIMPMRM